MKAPFVILLLFLSFPFGVAAQTVLTVDGNLARPSDGFTASCVSLGPAGASGKDVVWDFSGAEPSGAKHSVYYLGEDEDSLSEVEDGGISRLALDGNTLFIYEYEDRLKRIAFSRPVLRMAYPLAYNDSLRAPFEGFGTYCDNRHVKVSGYVKVVADGLGRLVLPGGFSFGNALRVTTTRRAVLRMALDSLALDSVKPVTEVELRHEWYVDGARYPVLKYVHSTTHDGQSVVAQREAAYLTTAEDDAALYEKADMNSNGAEPITPDGALTGYETSFGDGRLSVGYTLGRDAEVSLSVSDVSGIVYKQVHIGSQTAGKHTANIACSDLRSGEYVLSISVNGYSVGVKFSIK